MSTRISIGGLAYAYDISEEDLLEHINRGKPFRVQRLFDRKPDYVVTLFPQHIAFFFADE